MVEYLNFSGDFVFYFEGTFFIFSCITVPLYMFLLFVLIKAKMKNVVALTTPFFQIVIASSIIDLVTLLNNYFGAVFPKWGLWPSVYYFMGQPYLKLYFYIAWSTGICQAISVSIMASNRLYALLHPENYTKFWRGWRLKCALAAQYLVGMTCSLPIFITDVDLIPNEHGSGIVPKILNKSTMKAFFSIGGVFLVTNSLYLIIAYAYLYSMLRKRHKHRSGNINSSRHNVNRMEAKRRENRLFMMSSCVVFVQLCLLCFFVSFVFPWAKLTTDQFYMLYSALSDFYAGVNAYLLLIFSDSLRTFIKHLLCCSRTQENISIVSARHLRSTTLNHFPAIH